MIRRERYLSRIRPFYKKPIIKILVGIRRCGKSTLLSLIHSDLLQAGADEKSCFYLNLESPEGLAVDSQDKLLEKLTNFLEEAPPEKKYLFLDEVQEVPGWEKVVNAINVAYDVDLYLTGSNANLLSGQLATHLAGRYVSFMVQAFSFAEFCELYKDKNEEPEKLFQTFLRIGGMPFLRNLHLDYASSMQYLQDVYNSVLIRDVVRNRGIRDVDLLERVIRFAMDNIGQTFSALSLAKYLRNEGRTVSVDTILSYLQACEDAFLLERVYRENLHGKVILKAQEKFYLADHGFREAELGNNVVQIQQILENIVYRELKSLGYELTIGKNGEQEIDFVAEKLGERSYYQVCYLLADPSTVEREFGAYKGVDDNYQKYVLSLDRLDFSRKGIKHLNLIDWLLSEKC